MTLPIPFRRRRPAPAPTFVVERLLDRWQVIDGRWHRMAVAMRSDGCRRVVALLDEVAA